MVWSSDNMLSGKAAKDVEVDRIRDAKRVVAVHVDGFLKARRHAAIYTPPWDADGDGIMARSQNEFWLWGHPTVRVAFAQGGNPRAMARVLRKVADLLDGP